MEAPMSVRVVYGEFELCYNITQEDLPLFIRCLSTLGNPIYKRLIIYGSDRMSEEDK